MREAYFYEGWYVRAQMLESLDEYVRIGRPVGDFLYYVLCNDLKNACAHADRENLENIPAFAAYMYNHMPIQSQGSPAAYQRWMAHRGLAGLQEETHHD